MILSANKTANLCLGTASSSLTRDYTIWSVAEGTSEGSRIAFWYKTTKDFILIE